MLPLSETLNNCLIKWASWTTGRDNDMNSGHCESTQDPLHCLEYKLEKNGHFLADFLMINFQRSNPGSAGHIHCWLPFQCEDKTNCHSFMEEDWSHEKRKKSFHFQSKVQIRDLSHSWNFDILRLQLKFHDEREHSENKVKAAGQNFVIKVKISRWELCED